MRLGSATLPISAGAFAKEFGVSRQVIVQDIALLRANGEAITSLARGYVIDRNSACERVFKVCHTDDTVFEELCTIVDMGGIVKDVFIYHKIYGIVRAPMGIKSRADINEFMEGIKTGKSSLLKNVTAGYHYHTVTADKEETLDKIENELRGTGFIAQLMQFEPAEIKDRLK